MNDTMNGNLFVLTGLVSEMLPRFPIIGTDIPAQKVRMQVLGPAQAQRNTIIAERK